MTERIDELAGPAEVGTTYWVPTVTGKWHYATRAWPVIGPRHSDAQCLKFDVQHYHLDPRFLQIRADDADWWHTAFASPLQTNARNNPDGLPQPLWLRRKCLRLANPWLHTIITRAADHSNWECHFDQWTGKQARHDGRGWVCPHRAVPLVDHAAVDGVITCPLHLLRIDAATGRVLPPLPAETSAVLA